MKDGFINNFPGRIISFKEFSRRINTNKNLSESKLLDKDISKTPEGYLFYPKSNYPQLITGVEPKTFYKELNKLGLGPIIGVPCSIFKPFINYLVDQGVGPIIPPNEGPAMGIAAGSYAATGKPAIVFMQNSGLNNAANALTSLHELYKIPALLLISWRGETPEAPEHNIMGASLENFLNALQLPFEVLADNWQKQIEKLSLITKNDKTPVAAIVRKGFFSNFENKIINQPGKGLLTRLEVISLIKETTDNTVFVSSTGFPSRDSYAAKKTPDFYMLGSMGHTLSLAIGVAINKPDLKVVCFDGDGSALMHLGSLLLINKYSPKNFLYIILENGVYESTGGQQLINKKINFAKIGKDMMVPRSINVKTKKELEKSLKNFNDDRISTLLCVHLRTNDTSIGGRIQETPEEILGNFHNEIIKNT